MRNLESLCLAFAIALTPAVAGAQLNYSLINLTSGSPFEGTTANGINSAGHVTGYGVVPGSGEIHTFIYNNGNFQDLGLLGYQASDGISINNSDQLAVDGIGPGSRALFYSSGHAIRIGSIDGGYSSAYAINNHGDIVGSAWNGDGGIVGFSWIGGVFRDLSSLSIYRAASINDADQIVGTSIYSWGHGGEYVYTSSHAFLYSGQVFTDLGSLTGDPQTDTEAFGINDMGQIVGYSTASDGSRHAFLYSDGIMQDLGTMGGADAIALAINDNGLIIGNLVNAYGANLGAFVYTDGMMKNLGDLIVSGGTGWSQFVVTGINDSGSIVGYCTLDGGTQGFLAVPVQTAGAGAADAGLSWISSAQPNPFVTTTEITFAVSPREAAGDSRLEIFDPAGRRVATLLDKSLSPGEHSIAWSGHSDGGAEVPGGIYFARLTTPDGSTTRKLVLTK